MISAHFSTRHRSAASLLALLLSGTASPAVIFPKVTNTNNSGSGSLRAAMSAANANGADGAIIDFQIGSGCGPHIIYLDTALPDITAETHIEGYTQPGASKNTIGHSSGNNAAICIVLAGQNLVDDGLTVPATVADSLEMSVQGIAFSGFTHSAVNLRGGSNHVVAGIRTGGTMSGVDLETNSYGVILAPGVHDTTIGGDDNGDVNQFADITHNAIYVESATDSSVAAHDNTLHNDNAGFYFNAQQIRVASPTGGAGIALGGYKNSLVNIDLENTGASGLHISNTDAHNNTVTTSTITDNTGDGVLIDDDAHDNAVTDTDISRNGGAGVRVVNGHGNRILGNSMAQNSGLGIDLADEGVTANDNDSMQPAPDYANRGQNFPVLTKAAGGHYAGSVTGTLLTTPGTYQIQVFENFDCDDSGYGEGPPLAFRAGTTGSVATSDFIAQGQSVAAFNLPIVFSPFFFGGPIAITATATEADGNTSEFSACTTYDDDTIFYANFEPSLF
ncbi:MAG TPA: right-handed parallel beta-helix repeat-containing protein [Rudaea sp.]|jgi:hypothetical protein|nr:right-handed parallel beta-helix repeat-containing protein [Rudaea sp.]